MAGGKYSRARAGKAARLVGRGLRTMLFPFQLPRTRCNAHCHPSHTITSTHTHTHMLWVHSAKRSPKVRSTTVSASFSDLNAPTCAPPTDPGGKYQLTNLSPRAPKLCKSAICRGTTAACRSAPEWQTGKECRKRKIGVSPSGIVEDGAVVRPSPSDIIKGRSGAENVTELSGSKFVCEP